MQENQKKRREKRDLAISNDKEVQEFRLVLEKITEEYIKKFEEKKGKKEFEIPVNIFKQELSPLETVVKYLKENLNLPYKEIAISLNRSEKTVWQAYNFSRKKLPEKFSATISEYKIPISILKNRDFSILESVVSHLKNSHSLTYHQIAVLLNRDDRTIWTVNKRKNQKENEQ